jgi:hypothetical protein
VGLTAILKEAWTTSEQALDRREKIQALSLAKKCSSMKLDLLTNATVVDDAIRFVAGNDANKKPIARANADLQRQQPMNNADTSSTTNQVF